MSTTRVLLTSTLLALSTCVAAGASAHPAISSPISVIIRHGGADGVAAPQDAQHPATQHPDGWHRSGDGLCC